jgi:cytochrome c biogenesis factor
MPGPRQRMTEAQMNARAEALTGEKISVGPPYFNLTFGPLMLPLLLAMPFGPFLAAAAVVFLFAEPWLSVHLRLPGR